MSKVVGTVQAVMSSAGRSQTFWRFSVDGDKRSFGLGSREPKFTRGSLVSFVAMKSEKGFWEVDGEVELLQELPPSPPPGVAARVGAITTGTTSSGVRSTVSKDDYWKNREDRDVEKDKTIQLQSCRNSAIELVKVLLSRTGDDALIALPAAKKRYDFILNLVDELTQKFVDANDGKKEPEAATVDVVETPKTGTDNEDIWQ
jgi:hypothetical protein